MEIILLIIGIIFVFIFLSGKSGVGIKSSLIREIHLQRRNNTSSKAFPSISLEEAYNVLSPYDANNRYSSGISNYSEYSFWALVDGEPCLISVKKEPFKKNGITLLVTTNSFMDTYMSGLPRPEVPANLKSI